MGDKVKEVQQDRANLRDAQFVAALTESKRSEQGEVLSTLDKLRATRASRGGVGAPLSIPLHLKEGANTIIITDATNAPDKVDFISDGVKITEKR